MASKLLCLIILIIALISVNANPVGNPLFDEDPASAPPFNERLDVSQLNHRGDGQQINVFDNFPSFPVNQIPASYFLPTINIIDKTRELVYYRIGNPNNNGYIYWVNASVNYQVFTAPNYYICFLVPNYTYTKNLHEFTYMRRVGSVRLTNYAKEVKLQKQIDTMYGKNNKICRKSPDADIVDLYYGIMNDGSACGGDCGDQKGGVVIEYHVSRYARVCYGKVLIVDQKIEQYYPSNPTDSFRNRNTARYFYETFSIAKPVDINTLQDEINSACAINFPYSGMYNAACPWPDQINVPCGTSQVKGNSFAKITLNSQLMEKLKKHYTPEQVEAIQQRFNF
eukprot:TRINITY_DN15098_c0_g1_i1.p1 TRINITY_DN15098_c0_g1~~TRINITY_DN15098_c0_g1_i1.p1  ORF type:complete len:339 (+),score=84.34 TRINITY_DN15098_c0_g1_i1:99-1115(+)